MKFLVLIIVGLLLNLEVLAHGGGLNKKGCHNNRKIGDYHCHRGPNTSLLRHSPSKQETLIRGRGTRGRKGAGERGQVKLNSGATPLTNAKKTNRHTSCRAHSGEPAFTMEQSLGRCKFGAKFWECFFVG